MVMESKLCKVCEYLERLKFTKAFIIDVITCLWYLDKDGGLIRL